MSKWKNAFPKLPERGWFQRGDKGDEVKKLQKLLNWACDGTIIDKLNADGEYGILTENMVKFYQEVHFLTIDGQFGPVCLKSTRGMDINGAWRAIAFAVSVARDNSFAYGAGQRAHRSGCYFCQTNVGPRAKKKERKGEPHVVYDSHGNGHTYAKTYCCNTFITAAYAHGAKDPKILSICRGGGCCGMKPSEWERSPNFKRVCKCKDVPFTKLQRGDIIMNDGAKGGPGHVFMYLGFDKLVEAANGGWDSGSIAVKSGAKRRYNQYCKYDGSYVVRYTK